MNFNVIVLEIKHGNETYQTTNLIRNMSESYFKLVLRDEYGLDENLVDGYGIKKFSIKKNYEVSLLEFQCMKNYLKFYDNNVIDVVSKYGTLDKK